MNKNTKETDNQMYHFIVNPNSRSGQGQLIWKDIERELKQRQIVYQVYFTRFKRHAAKIAGEITSDGAPHTLVVLGGDGSINEVINGIHFPSQTTLGYIPVGSGNDFARGLNLPSKPLEALDLLLSSSSTRELDIGLLQYPNRQRRFVVSSGIGYDASICHKLGVSSLKTILNRLKLGKLAYVALALDRLYHCKPQEMTVILDDERHINFQKTYFAAAMNLPFEGGGCKFCPSAAPDDGLLELIVIADVPKIHALAILPTVFFGKHTHLKGVHIYQCQKAEIYSSAALPIHTDGEPIFLQRSAIYSLAADHVKLLV